jgi:hypothetical protein
MLKKVIAIASMCACAGTALFLPGEGQSANMPGIAGYFTNATCIERFGGSLRNNCGIDDPRVTIPVPLTSYKTYTLKARMRGSVTHASTCKGVRWDNTNGNWNSTLTGVTSDPEFVPISLGTISVPNGSLTFECTLAGRYISPQWGAVLSVDWN